MTRRPLAPAMFLGAALVLGAVGASAVAVSASAAPNRETVLPADGVTSIERAGDVWTVTTVAAPSEVKVMDPFNSPLCGINYPQLGACTTTTTFTAAADCVYLQVDGIPGHNSSDPYVCRPTNGETSSPTSSSSSYPTSTPESSPGTSSPGTPSSQPTDATATPTSLTPPSAEPSPEPTPTKTAVPQPVSHPSFTSSRVAPTTVPSSQTSEVASPTPAPIRDGTQASSLPATGLDEEYLAVAAWALGLALLGMLISGRQLIRYRRTDSLAADVEPDPIPQAADYPFSLCPHESNMVPGGRP